MANGGLTLSNSIRVHQTLHGYTDGHRLLGSSIKLNAHDEKAMLIMSDISGPSATLHPQGYLTGYPLSESGLFALARTWPAIKMERPGCVWTHTLLLDFADLATLVSTDFLLDYFRLPNISENVSTYYGSPFDIKLKNKFFIPSIDSASCELLKNILWGLYFHPHKEIFIRAPSNIDIEHLVIAVWNQQWPRLRRNFRFCTMSFADRSTTTTPFDLQITPKDIYTERKSSIVVNSKYTDNDEKQEWLDLAISDIFDTERNNLRAFLYEMGGDISGGRGKFVTLCNLYTISTTLKNNPNIIERGIDIFEKEFHDAEARNLKYFLAKEAAKKSGSLKQSGIRFLMKNFSLLSNETNLKGAVRDIWLYPFESINDVPMSINETSLIESIINHLPVSDVIDGLANKIYLASSALHCRPEIALSPNFWNIKGITDNEPAMKYICKQNSCQKIINAMIQSNAHGLVDYAQKCYDLYSILASVLTYIDTQGLECIEKNAEHWLLKSIQSPDALAKLLSSQVIRNKTTLIAVAKVTKPTTVPNEFGADPWVLALQNATGNTTIQGEIYLATYLYLRALCSATRDVDNLLQTNFEFLYRIASESGLTDESINLLNSILDKYINSQEWDYCYKITEAMTDFIVAHHMSTKFYLSLTSDDNIFEKIIKITAKKRSGRVYLRSVLKFSKHTNLLPEFRRQIILHCLDKNESWLFG